MILPAIRVKIVSVTFVKIFYRIIFYFTNMATLLKTRKEYFVAIPLTVGKSIDELQLMLENVDSKKDQLLLDVLKTYWSSKILSWYLVGIKMCMGATIFILLLDFKISSGMLIAPLFFFGAMAHFIEKITPGLHQQTGKPSPFEQIISPLADRLLMLPIIFYSLVMVSRPLLFLILFAEIIHAIISLMAVDKNVPASRNIFMKAKTGLQFVMLLGILAFWPAPAHIIFVGGLAVSLIFMAFGIIFNGITISLNHEARTPKNIQHAFGQEGVIATLKKQEA